MTQTVQALPAAARFIRWEGHSSAPTREDIPMLIVSRRPDESIQIKLAGGVDDSLTLKELFAQGPIEITLLKGKGRNVRMGIAAPPELAIRRKG